MRTVSLTTDIVVEPCSTAPYAEVRFSCRTFAKKENFIVNAFYILCVFI